MKNLYKFLLACLFVLVVTLPLANPVHAQTTNDYHAYVTSTTENNVSVIDKVSNSVIATIPVGDNPTDVKAYPPNHRVYVANYFGQSVSVIDTDTNTVVTTIPLGTGTPFGLALNSDGSRLYASGGSDNNVYVIDTATNTVIATITGGFNIPYNLTVNPTGTRLYVVNDTGNPAAIGYVSVVDTSNYTVLTTIPVHNQPTGIGITPDGTKVYVANLGGANPGNTVSVIDTATNTVIHDIMVPLSPTGIAFNSTGSRVYVSSQNNGGIGDGTVSVINTVTDQVIASVSMDVGGSPNELAVSPDDNYIYEVPNAGNTTQIIDAATNTVTGSITVGLHPWGIAFGELFTVNLNTPPQINTFSGATINEGDTYTANGSFTDPDSTSWTGKVDYGDGTGEHDFASPNESLDQTNHTFSISHVYKDNGTYTVTVKITDNQGATGTGTAQVTVNNVAPTPGAISVSTNPVQANNATSASASFTDPGVLDTHTASWNWGDGNTTTGTVSESNGSGTVGADSHTYTTAGVYTITLTVTDKDGGAGTQTFQYVSVYNPTSQGLFSAGSHFTSPAGAYAQNTSLTGTVKFGLSYKYQGTMPVGDKQFTMNFSAANLLFNATTISSLVISNSMATLTGTGTINGGSQTYNFLVTGVDGGGIRVQITNPSNNNAVIYDTQPGDPATATPITSVTGNVIVHN